MSNHWKWALVPLVTVGLLTTATGVADASSRLSAPVTAVVEPTGAMEALEPMNSPAVAEAWIEASGPWYKKTYYIFLNRGETWTLAYAPSSLAGRLPLPWPLKAAITAYMWVLSKTAKSAYRSGNCVLLVSTVYGGFAAPPGAAAYRDWRCN